MYVPVREYILQFLHIFKMPKLDYYKISLGMLLTHPKLRLTLYIMEAIKVNLSLTLYIMEAIKV